jgi:hypothetical protein
MHGHSILTGCRRKAHTSCQVLLRTSIKCGQCQVPAEQQHLSCSAAHSDHTHHRNTAGTAPAAALHILLCSMLAPPQCTRLSNICASHVLPACLPRRETRSSQLQSLMFCCGTQQAPHLQRCCIKACHLLATKEHCRCNTGTPCLPACMQCALSGAAPSCTQRRNAVQQHKLLSDYTSQQALRLLQL